MQYLYFYQLCNIKKKYIVRNFVNKLCNDVRMKLDNSSGTAIKKLDNS